MYIWDYDGKWYKYVDEVVRGNNTNIAGWVS